MNVRTTPLSLTTRFRSDTPVDSGDNADIIFLFRKGIRQSFLPKVSAETTSSWNWKLASGLDYTVAKEQSSTSLCHRYWVRLATFAEGPQES